MPFSHSVSSALLLEDLLDDKEDDGLICEDVLSSSSSAIAMKSFATARRCCSVSRMQAP